MQQLNKLQQLQCLQKLQELQRDAAPPSAAQVLQDAAVQQSASNAAAALLELAPWAPSPTL
eukprot:1734456-Prymnesium_polylepis.1